VSEPNLLPLIQRVRAEYGPTMTVEQVGAAIYRIAREAGPEWGLLLKPHGHGVPSPIGPISADILIHIPEEQEYDAFTDAGGVTGPVFRKLPFKVGKCFVDPDDGLTKCSGASMDRVRSVSGDAPAPGPAPIPSPPVPAPAPPQPLGPAQPYSVMEPFGVEIGELLGVPGSPYVGNLPAATQVAVYLTHNIQFHGWTLEQARENARERAAS
jgi:hypothetical protein